MKKKNPKNFLNFLIFCRKVLDLDENYYGQKTLNAEKFFLA